MSRKEPPQELPAVGSSFVVRGKRTFEVLHTPYFTTKHDNEEWYVFFREIGDTKASPYVVCFSQVKKLEKSLLAPCLLLPKYVPSVGKQYEHFKGGLYEVLAIGFNPFEADWFVCYKALYDHPIADSFVRTLSDWNEIPRTSSVPRFLQVN